MSHRGQNSVNGTVQYWNGTRWLSFNNLVFSTTGVDAVLTSPNGNFTLAAGANNIVTTCATFAGTYSAGMAVTATGGSIILQAVGGGVAQLTGESTLLRGLTTTATVQAQTNLILTASTGTFALQSIGSTGSVTAQGGLTLSTGAGTLAVSGPTTTITATTALRFNAGVSMTWPAADGASGTVLTTNGAGILSFQAVAAGAAAYSVLAISANPNPSAATLQANQITYACTSTGGAFSVTLPAAIPVSGTRVVVKDVAGSAGTNNITIAGNGNNIDGAASQIIATNYGSFTLQSNGTTWMII